MKAALLKAKLGPAEKQMATYATDEAFREARKAGMVKPDFPFVVREPAAILQALAHDAAKGEIDGYLQDYKASKAWMMNRQCHAGVGDLAVLEALSTVMKGYTPGDVLVSDGLTFRSLGADIPLNGMALCGLACLRQVIHGEIHLACIDSTVMWSLAEEMNILQKVNEEVNILGMLAALVVMDRHHVEILQKVHKKAVHVTTVKSGQLVFVPAGWFTCMMSTAEDNSVLCQGVLIDCPGAHESLRVIAEGFEGMEMELCAKNLAGLNEWLMIPNRGVRLVASCQPKPKQTEIGHENGYQNPDLDICTRYSCDGSDSVRPGK